MEAHKRKLMGKLGVSYADFLRPEVRGLPNPNNLKEIVKILLELLHIYKNIMPKKEKIRIINSFVHYKNILYHEHQRNDFQKLINKTAIEVFVEHNMVPKSKKFESIYSVTKKLPDSLFQELITKFL